MSVGKSIATLDTFLLSMCPTKHLLATKTSESVSCWKMHSLSALLDQQHIFRYIDYEVDRLIFALSIDLFSDSRFA